MKEMSLRKKEEASKEITSKNIKPKIDVKQTEMSTKVGNTYKFERRK